MKKHITFFVFLLTTMISCGQSATGKKTIIQKLDFAYLENCETGKGECKPVQITRENKQDSIILVFPSGGTQSDVYLHGLSTNTIQLHDQKFTGQGNPSLNLTGLDDGEYTASISSCGLGGSCLVKIVTTPPIQR